MDSTPEQLRFASIPGCTIRADFAGGGLSSDLGPLLLKGVDAIIAAANLISFGRLCRSAIDHHRHSTDAGQCAIGTGGQFGAVGTRRAVRDSRRQHLAALNYGSFSSFLFLTIRDGISAVHALYLGD